jgi:alpha-L-rhamnosidase
MNSRNHFALGCVGEWIWNTLTGINISDEAPGFKEVIIRPQPVDDLTWVKADYETNYGLLKVDWEKEKDVFTLNLTVPPNSSARVILPKAVGALIKEGGVEIGTEQIEGIEMNDDGEILAAAGTYTFTIE